MAKRWTDLEIGHIKYLLQRNRASSTYAVAREAHKKLKNRSVTSINHKINELISKSDFTDSVIELEGVTFPAKVISGYIIITLENGAQIPAHHYVWCKHYGEILEGHHIHHRNYNRLDNNIRNLSMMTAADHIKLHSKNTPPESALMFYFLNEKNLWDDYLRYREVIISEFNNNEEE